MFSTGHPSEKTHHSRNLAAAKTGPPETIAGTFSAGRLKGAGSLQEAGCGGEVTEVNASDRTLRRYTSEECRGAAADFRSKRKSEL